MQTAVLATGLSLGAILVLLDGELCQIVQPAGWDHCQGGPDVLRGRPPHGWRGRKGSERQHQRSAFFLSEEGLRAWLAAGNTPGPAADRPAGSSTVVPAQPAPTPPTTPPAAARKPAAAAAGFCCIDAEYGLLHCIHRPAAPGTPTTPGGAVPVAPAPRAALPSQPTTAPAATAVVYVDRLVELVRQARPGTVAGLAVAAEDALSLLTAPDGQTAPTAAALAHLAVTEHGVAPLLRLLPGLLGQLTTTTARSTR